MPSLLGRTTRKVRLRELIAGAVLIAIGAVVVATLSISEYRRWAEERNAGSMRDGSALRMLASHRHVDFKTEQAKALVGIDRGANRNGDDTERADPRDFAVLHVEELLTELSRDSSKSVATIAQSACGAADLLQRDYGSRITRQQILEDLCSAYRNGELQNDAAAEYHKFVYEWAKGKYRRTR
jgi:hypothetical protein